MRDITVSLQERLSRLEKLDLGNVRRKLMEPYPEGKGWTAEQTVEAEKWYKRYIATIIVHPTATRHVPNGPIDAFWHQHILDTNAYGQDCMSVLGYFLHHYPYFGLNGDEKQRDNSFVETNELYRQMFGEDCTQMKHFNKGGEGSYCDGGGGGSSCNKAGKALNCHGEGCSQGCSNCGRDNANPTVDRYEKAHAGVNCNSGGSGTGCGQGCGRGGKFKDFGPPRAYVG